MTPNATGQERISRDAIQMLARLPGGGGHTSRTVRVGPDARVYLSLGISGNCSDQYLDPSYPFADQRGGILVLEETGKQANWRVSASGLRNPIGFDWQPRTRVLYANHNGPDHWGYEQPPEYFSRVVPGSFHGMPWFQYDGKVLRRDRCVDREPPRTLQEVSKPAAVFPARNAPIGLAFIVDDELGADLRGNAVVALHASWATRPDGERLGNPASRREPKVVIVRFEQGKVRRVDDLITGFQLPNGDRWARPAGVAPGPDGALYFTVDAGANALFRLSKAG